MTGARARRLFVGTAATLGLCGVALGAYAAADSRPASPLGAKVQVAGAESSARSAEAFGLNPADAIPVFQLRNGEDVAAVGSSDAACLIRTKGGQSTETCDSRVAINEGRAVSVLDECGTSGRNLMEITGLAPDGVSAARLAWTDGTVQAAAIVHGAFRFEASNPAPGAAYPTGIGWINTNGSSVGQAVFPVRGDQFCLPTE